MKYLIRNIQNGMYYKHPDSWVVLPQNASDLGSLEGLLPLARRADAASLETLVTSDTGEALFGVHVPSLPQMIGPA